MVVAEKLSLLLGILHRTFRMVWRTEDWTEWHRIVADRGHVFDRCLVQISARTPILRIVRVLLSSSRQLLGEYIG